MNTLWTSRAYVHVLERNGHCLIDNEMGSSLSSRSMYWLSSVPLVPWTDAHELHGEKGRPRSYFCALERIVSLIRRPFAFEPATRSNTSRGDMMSVMLGPPFRDKRARVAGVEMFIKRGRPANANDHSGWSSLVGMPDGQGATSRSCNNCNSACAVAS